MHIKFFENYGSKLMISTKKGNLKILDIFTFKQYKNFNLNKFKEKLSPNE